MTLPIPSLALSCTILLASGCTLATKEKEVSPIPERGETLLPTLNQQQFIVNPLDKNHVHAKSKDNSSIDWTGIERVLDQAEAQTESRLVAVFSLRDSLGSWYHYHLQPLGFSPEAMKEAGDRTQLFIYEPDSDELGSVPRIAIARIPAGERAFKEMEAWILPILPKTYSTEKSPLNIQKSTCSWKEVAPAASVCWAGGCSYYPPIYELVCEGPPSGNDDGGSDPNMRWPVGGGGPGGGSGGPPAGEECRPPYGCPDEGDPEPCNTGIAELDDPNVQQGLKDLWEDSNYDTDGNPNPEHERKEQVGFIVPNGNGFTFQQLPQSLIVSQGPCDVTFRVSNISPNSIFVHTHPYNNGESQSHCVSAVSRPIYSSIPVREADKKALNAMNVTKGIVIDNENIVYFNNQGNIEYLIERCGY